MYLCIDEPFLLCFPYIFHFFLFRSSYIFNSFTKPSIKWWCSLSESSPIIDIPISMGLSEMTTSHALSKAILNNLSHCLTFSNWLITIFSQFEFGLFVEFGSNTNHHYSKKHMSLGRLYQKKIWFLKTLNLYEYKTPSYVYEKSVMYIYVRYCEAKYKTILFQILS